MFSTKISFIISIKSNKNNSMSFAIIDKSIVGEVIEYLNKKIGKTSRLVEKIQFSSSLEAATELSSNEVLIFNEYFKKENVLDDVKVIKVETKFSEVDVSLDIKDKPLIRGSLTM